MKNPFIISAIFLIILINSSCRHNRLKTNRKELTQEILLQEKKQKEEEAFAHNKDSIERMIQPSGGFRLKEDRSIDSDRPPLIINIAGSLNNIKELKLSDIASEIRYIRLEPIPDSTFSREMKFKYYLLPNNIIATNPSGILLYTKEGKFITTIVKNKTIGITVDSDKMIVTGTNTFIGGSTSVWISGDDLFYSYRNSLSGQEYIMEYNLSKQQIGLPKQYDQEVPDKIIGQGEIAIDMNPLKKRPEWKYKISPDLVMWSMRAKYIYQSVGIVILDKNSYLKELEMSDKIAVFNNHGDTLTTFTGFDKGNTLRLENEGKQYLWNNLNDTVFQVVGFNRIIPISVLNLGQYKASMEQIREIGFDLTGKIIAGSWAQNKRFIFLTLCKDAYDSPNNRKNKKVKIYYAIFSKLNHQVSIIKGNPLNYSPQILENDIDGGLPVWPLSYMVGYDGEILLSLKGKDLTERLRSKEFEISGAPESKKKEFSKIAGSVSESDDILMIIK